MRVCVCARARVRVRVRLCVNYFSTVLSLAGNSSRLTWVRHNNRKSSMCIVFVCPNNGMVASVWEF